MKDWLQTRRWRTHNHVFCIEKRPDGRQTRGIPQVFRERGRLGIPYKVAGNTVEIKRCSWFSKEIYHFQVSLYEAEKPSSALDYLKNNFTGKEQEVLQVKVGTLTKENEALAKENASLKEKVQQLEADKAKMSLEMEKLSKQNEEEPEKAAVEEEKAATTEETPASTTESDAPEPMEESDPVPPASDDKEEAADKAPAAAAAADVDKPESNESS